MKKLHEFLLLNKVDGNIGIEIEVEGLNLPNIADAYWTSVEDNSLRGGREYIFNKPRPFKVVPKMINYLNKQFEKYDSKLIFSFRTSVHVHVNVQQFTWTQVLNFIYTYLLLEDPLMRYCHPVRSANRFCLRASDAEELITVFADMFAEQDKNGVVIIPKDKMRYAALNVEALSKYGSLEFRALEGNNNAERITIWCQFIEKIHNYSLKMESPTHIYDAFIKSTPKEFVETVMEDASEHLVVEEADILRSFSISIELPFEYKKGMEYRAAYDKNRLSSGSKVNKMVFDAVMDMPREINVPIHAQIKRGRIVA